MSALFVSILRNLFIPIHRSRSQKAKPQRTQFDYLASAHKTWPWITTPFIPRFYTTIILRDILQKSGLSSWITIVYPRAWNRLIHAVLYPVIIPSIMRWISMKDIQGQIQASRGYP